MLLKDIYGLSERIQSFQDEEKRNQELVEKYTAEYQVLKEQINNAKGILEGIKIQYHDFEDKKEEHCITIILEKLYDTDSNSFYGDEKNGGFIAVDLSDGSVERERAEFFDGMWIPQPYTAGVIATECLAQLKEKLHQFYNVKKTIDEDMDKNKADQKRIKEQLNSTKERCFGKLYAQGTCSDRKALNIIFNLQKESLDTIFKIIDVAVNKNSDIANEAVSEEVLQEIIHTSEQNKTDEIMHGDTFRERKKGE